MSDTTKFFESKKYWSTYKDRLLKYYLALYFPKILGTGRDTLFIDGFAGKGIFDDGTLGSPLIVKEKVAEAHSKSKYSNKIIPIFIEYKKKNAKTLITNLNCDWCFVQNKDYKEEAYNIIARNTHRNIFLYADPFGIKHLRYNVFEKLSKNSNSVELLFNLSSFGFIREGCRLLNVNIDEDLNNNAGEEYNDEETTFVNDIENMNKIANGTYWQDIIKEMKTKVLTTKQAEEKFVKQYITVLENDFKYVFQIPIKTGDNNMPKYRMVFATNHIQGALLMRENMIRCNNDMIIDNHNQQSSFFDYQYARTSCASDIITTLTNLETDFMEIDCKDLCMLLYKNIQNSYLHSDIRNALTELENNRTIMITRKQMYTPTGKLSKSFDFVKNDIKVRLI